MEKHYLITKLESLDPLDKITSDEEAIESYIPLAMKLARSASFKKGIPYEDAVELALYYLTLAVNTAKELTASYIRKFIASRLHTAIFEDKTIRLPRSSYKGQEPLQTTPMNETTEKISAVGDLDTLISEAGFDPDEEEILRSRIAGLKDKDIAQSLGITAYDMRCTTKKMKEKV